MHPTDVLRYGHSTFMRSIEDLPPELWHEPGACGSWSIRDIVAHIASYEQMLVEVAESLHDDAAETPALDRMTSGAGAWNDDEVARRAGRTADALVDEYRSAHDRALDLLAALPDERWRTAGILKWYGEDYDLEDFVVYTFYGHKREHAGQIGVFRGAWAESGSGD